MLINRLGAIDIGSNSVKLLISDVINYKGQVINKKYLHTRIPLRLGDDTFLHGYISDDKKEKLAQLLQTFKYFLEINDTESYRVCATSALREASNKQEIIDYIAATVGVEVDIISSQDEANFIFLNAIDEKYKPETLCVMVDVGGGSTEIVLSKGNELIENKSFMLGTIRHLSPEQKRNEWIKLKTWLEDKTIRKKEICLIGSGGNINKINSLFKRKGKMRRIDLNDYYRRLTHWNYEERIIKSDIGLNRSEVILPALNIYLNVMKFLKVDVIQIPVVGIADGIIKDIYLKNTFQMDLQNET